MFHRKNKYSLYHVAVIIIINPRLEYWPSWRSNPRPSVLKSCTLPTELHGLSSVIGKKFFWRKDSNSQEIFLLSLDFNWLFQGVSIVLGSGQNVTSRPVLNVPAYKPWYQGEKTVIKEKLLQNHVKSPMEKVCYDSFIWSKKSLHLSLNLYQAAKF